MRLSLLVTLLFLLFAPFAKAQHNAQALAFEVPEVVIANVPTAITVHCPLPDGTYTFVVNNRDTLAQHVTDSSTVVQVAMLTSDDNLTISSGNHAWRQAIHPIPLWLSILPPLIAILIALIFREVLSALLLGIFSGTAIIGAYTGGLAGIGSGLLAVLDTYIINALNNWDHLAVILFSMTIGAVVAVISKNGGMQGVVNIVSRFATTARSGQLATWLLGVAIFFDDYANTLVVGNTMRAVTDRLRISREKLAYLVDSTAAPIAAIALVTTWIGFELGQIDEALAKINAHGTGIEQGVYSVFLGSLQYAFYPVFTLVFMLLLVLRGRDFGPMHKAEMRARTTGQVSKGVGRQSPHNESKDDDMDEFEPKAGIQPRAINAIIPILVIVLGTIAGLFYTGWGAQPLEGSGLWAQLTAIIGDSNSYISLLWSSSAGLAVAILLTVAQRGLSLAETMESALNGFKTMLPAVIILVLAWALASVTETMHTADFLTGVLEGNISPWVVPALTFVISALVAFSTGSSWSTMAILYPIMLPAAWNVSIAAGYDPAEALAIFLNVTSAVLAGSVLGDHCSPISDTTILSSLASSCNHIDHVRTQLPYALTVGAVALLIGTIPGALGINGWLLMPVGIAVLYAIVHFFGKPVPEQAHIVEQ